MDRHIIRSAWWFGLIFLSLDLVNPVAAQVDQQRAETYFKEAATLCQRDGGRLWGVSLCGPMVFADARTRTLATNQPRPTDEWPRVLGFTNAPLEWGGLRWAAYMWDFTTALPTARVRGEFMLHELFHRIQPELGLISPGSNASGQNAHLDTVEGRVWMRLEWRALSRELSQTGETRKRTLSDAIAFRLKRLRSLPMPQRVSAPKKSGKVSPNTPASSPRPTRAPTQLPARLSTWPGLKGTRRSYSKRIHPVWPTRFCSMTRRRIGGAACAATPISGRC